MNMYSVQGFKPVDMSYSFWKSSHFEQWLMEKSELLKGRAEDLKIYTEEEYQKILIFFCNMLQSIAQDLQASNNGTKIRMQVVATATLYFKRFYIKRSFKDVDPFLMAPTCLMLAAKVEEFGALSTNKMSSAVNNYVKKTGISVDLTPLRVGSLLEAEFILIEVIDCCLICFQPYRPLKQLFQDLRDLPSTQYKDLESLEASAVKIINDAIRTDLSMIYPPHMIAIGAFQLSAISLHREKEFINWFADLQVEMEKILDIVYTLTSMYKVWKTAEDKEIIKTLFDRMPKPNPNPPPQQQQMQQMHMMQQRGTMGGRGY